MGSAHTVRAKLILKKARPPADEIAIILRKNRVLNTCIVTRPYLLSLSWFSFYLMEKGDLKLKQLSKETLMAVSVRGRHDF